MTNTNGVGIVPFADTYRLCRVSVEDWERDATHSFTTEDAEYCQWTLYGVTSEIDDAETIIVVISDVISKHGVLAAIVAGLILAGILAATMSTADSQLLVAASGVSENIVRDFFGKNLSDKKSLSIARITILIVSAIGLFIARDPNSNVFSIVSFAWAGMGAAFAGVMLCALFWKRTTLAGALAGMVTGGVMAFVWKYLVRPIGGVFDIYELLPAFIISLVVIVVVSLLTKAPSQDMIDEFEKSKISKKK